VTTLTTKESDMSVPQVEDRPASGLRAVFAGIGSLLSGKKSKDKLRLTPEAAAPAAAAPTAPAQETTAEAPEAAEPETAAVAEPEATVEVEAEAVAEATVEAEAVAEAEAAEPEAEVVAEAEAEAESTVELPLANYDELTVASMRARLRNLSNDDLVQLKEYEAANQNRPEVIKMFTNRLIKMTSSLPKLEEK
jgi:hypothetical protein